MTDDEHEPEAAPSAPDAAMSDGSSTHDGPADDGRAPAGSPDWAVFGVAGALALGFVVFALWLAFSRFGRIRLGGDDERPAFRTVSWIAMMFSAGMGIGLMFYGVAEPLSFYTQPPPGSVPPGDQVEALRTAMATAPFHWTLHPWAIYAVVGLAIACSTFRKGRRQLISSAFVPLIGEKRANGALGKAIDIIAIFATIFGSAASLGLGALQIGGGLEATGLVKEVGNGVLIPMIIVLTAAFVLSAVSGIAPGIHPLILRENKGTEVIEEAVRYGTKRLGDHFYLRVRTFPGMRPRPRPEPDDQAPALRSPGDRDDD